MLSSEEKRQLALLAAKIDVENSYTKYEKEGKERFVEMTNDLANQYCEAMKILNNQFAPWNH